VWCVVTFGVYVWYLVYVYVCEIWCVCVCKINVCVCMYVCIHVFFRDCHLSFIFEKTKSINNDSIAKYAVKTVRLFISVTVSYR